MSHLSRARIARTNYDRHWSHTYKEPGIRAHLLAALVFFVPKVGAASDLAIKIPTPETQDWYLRSVNRTGDVFRETLDKARGQADPPISLVNLDLDTGRRAELGDYALADQTYRQLLRRLISRSERRIPTDLKRHLLDYYATAAGDTPANPGIAEDLSKLRKLRTTAGP